MTPRLSSDDRPDFGPLATGHAHGIASETVDVDYFQRRPRATACKRAGVQVPGLFRWLRLRQAFRSGLTVASSAR